MVRTPRAAFAIAPMILLALSACGGGSSAATGSQANSTASGYPGSGGGGGMRDNAQFQKMQECLSAAGIDVPTPNASARPSGGARPTDMPSFSPGATPSGGFGNGNGGGRGGGGMGQIFQSKEAHAALKACGIEVPTGRPTASPTASS